MASSSHERVVKGYLKPSLHLFLEKYQEVYEISESAAVGQAVKALHDSMPKDVRERIVRTPGKNSY